MNTPKTTDEAKAFLRSRLNAEQSMSKNLDIVLYYAAQNILSVCKRYAVDPKDIERNLVLNFMFKTEIMNIIKRLKEELYDDVELLSVFANQQDKEGIIAFINKEAYEHTLVSRIDTHVETFYKELIAFIVAKESFTKTIPKSFIITQHGRNYLERLLRDTIARAWMNEQKEQAIKEGAIGFISHRGSSYPCSTCDDYTGFHTLDDFRLPLHPNCCCYATYVFAN